MGKRALILPCPPRHWALTDSFEASSTWRENNKQKSGNPEGHAEKQGQGWRHRAVNKRHRWSVTTAGVTLREGAQQERLLPLREPSPPQRPAALQDSPGAPGRPPLPYPRPGSRRGTPGALAALRALADLSKAVITLAGNCRLTSAFFTLLTGSACFFPSSSNKLCYLLIYDMHTHQLTLSVDRRPSTTLLICFVHCDIPRAQTVAGRQEEIISLKRLLAS